MCMLLSTFKFSVSFNQEINTIGTNRIILPIEIITESYIDSLVVKVKKRTD